MRKFLISFLLLLSGICYAKEPVFVSTSPSLTEMMYALGAQDMLKAVSTQCSFPEEAKSKPIIGDNYFIDQEMLLKIKPDYFLGTDSSEFLLNKYKHFGIKPLCYKYANIDEIYANITDLGHITGKEERAKEIVEELKRNIQHARSLNKHEGLKVLYLVQSQPIVTIGKKSFITDIIEKSGNHSITSDINSYYPAVNEEFIIKEKPDIIVIDYYCTDERVKKLFPNTPIVAMDKSQTDIIDRPGPRIYQSVEFFALLGDKFQNKK